MSSTVIITAGALASMSSAGADTAASLGVAGLGLGPVGLGLIAGAALIAFLSSSAGKDKVSSSVAISHKGTQNAVSEAWQQTKKELIAESAGIASTYERERVIASIGSAEAQYKSALTSGDASSAGQIVNRIREKMFSLHVDELILKDKQSNLLKMLSGIKAKAPEAFIPELEAISKDIPADNLPLSEQSRTLLRSEYISRAEYNEVYKAVRTVFQAQAGRIIETLFTSTIESELEDMGYHLLDEAGNPVKLTQGKIQTLDTPYDGYKLRVKIGEDHTVATRLVRAVGSEAEKSSVSEYQKQKDKETGRKLCSDLDKIYDTLRKDGLMINEVMRKELGQEAVDVVVDKP